MNEVQFVSHIVNNFFNGISDFSPTALDRLYEVNDEEFERQGEVVERLQRVFEQLYSLEKRAITDTIFQRQTLIFSLILALDAQQHIPTRKLEQALFAMDAAFKDEDVTTDAIEAFRNAAASSTQRISSRKVRDTFIRGYL